MAAADEGVCSQLAKVCRGPFEDLQRVVCGNYGLVLLHAASRTSFSTALALLDVDRPLQAYAGPVGAAALPHAQAGWWPRWPRDSSGGSNSTGVAAHRLAAQLRAGASFGRVQAMWTGRPLIEASPVERWSMFRLLPR